LLPEPLQSAASIQVPLVRGRVAAARGDHSEAVEIAEAVLDRLRRSGFGVFVADTLLLKGRALGASERPAEAEVALRDAESSARELGHDRVRWEILAALGSMVGGVEGKDMLEGARAIVERIADGLDADLRASFLARPDVAASVPKS
jgi:hypothetical protein